MAGLAGDYIAVNHFKAYGAVVQSHQGTSPGVDFTYTVKVNIDEARGPVEIAGLTPPGRPEDWDVVARPSGYDDCLLVEIAPSRWRFYITELPAVEDCEA